jgi:hypothetical protein
MATASDLEEMFQRLTTSPELCSSVLGSMLTGVLAAAAAFHLSLPDRTPFWALLPLPAAVLWIIASAIGCLRPAAADITAALPRQSSDCVIFILGLSVPLSIVLLGVVRLGCSLRPSLTSGISGLACVATAATLLNFVHTHEQSVSDLAVHALVVVLVVLVNVVFGGRLLAKDFLLRT